MRRYLDVRLPFFLPVWRRVALTLACIGWAGLELFVTGSPFWAIIFGAIGVYCFYEFFVVFDPENYKEKDKP